MWQKNKNKKRINYFAVPLQNHSKRRIYSKKRNFSNLGKIHEKYLKDLEIWGFLETES